MHIYIYRKSTQTLHTLCNAYIILFLAHVSILSFVHKNSNTNLKNKKAHVLKMNKS